MHYRHTTSFITTLLFCLLLALSTGCMERTLTITSEPSGALVHLNHQEIGRTPITVPYEFYGTYAVELTHRQRRKLSTTRELSQPFYEYPLIDLLGELFVSKTEHSWHFDLPKKQPINNDHLLDHAKQMKAQFDRPAIALPK